MKLAQAFLLVFMLICDSQQIGLNMGPYDLIITQVTDCAPPEEGMFHFVLRPYFVKRDGKKTQLFSGDAYLPFTEEEFHALIFQSEHFQRKNNNYLLMYKHKDNVCTGIEMFVKKTITMFKEKVGVQNKACDIPPGNYSFEDWKPVINPGNVHMLEYGSYKTILHLFLGTKLVGCIDILGDVKRKV